MSVIDPPSPTVGDRIRRERKRRGWTQAALAEKVGASASYIKELENGDDIPVGSRVLAAVAAKLDLDLDEPAPIQPTAANDWDLADVPETVLVAELARRAAVRDHKSPR